MKTFKNSTRLWMTSVFLGCVLMTSGCGTVDCNQSSSGHGTVSFNPLNAAFKMLSPKEQTATVPLPSNWSRMTEDQKKSWVDGQVTKMISDGFKCDECPDGQLCEKHINVNVTGHPPLFTVDVEAGCSPCPACQLPPR